MKLFGSQGFYKGLVGVDCTWELNLEIISPLHRSFTVSRPRNPTLSPLTPTEVTIQVRSFVRGVGQVTKSRNRKTRMERTCLHHRRRKCILTQSWEDRYMGSKKEIDLLTTETLIVLWTCSKKEI